MRWDVDWSTGSLRAPRSVAKQRRRWIPCFTGWFLFLIMAALCCLAHYPDVPFTRRILPPHYKWLNTDGAQVLTHPFAEWEVLTHPFIQDAAISREELAQYDLGRRNVTTEAEAQQPLSYGIDRGWGRRVRACLHACKVVCRATPLRWISPTWLLLELAPLQAPGCTIGW